jgi:hypothetical protein
MVVYCTVEDVQRALLNITFDTTTKPSIADIEGVAATPPSVPAQIGYIDIISAEIDGMLMGAGIDPATVTDAGKLLILLRICVDGVAAMVMRAIGVDPASAYQFQKSYQDALKRIRDNPSEIESTAPSGAYVTGRVPAAGEERHWSREDDNW